MSRGEGPVKVAFRTPRTAVVRRTLHPCRADQATFSHREYVITQQLSAGPPAWDQAILGPGGSGSHLPIPIRLHLPGHLPAPDPVTAVGSYLASHLVGAVATVLTTVCAGFLNGLASPLARYVLQTPDLATEPTLRHYWLTALAVLAALAGLLLALAGLTLIPGSSWRGAVLARENIGVGLLGGLATAFASLPLVALEVQAANRVVGVFVSQGLDAPGNPAVTALRGALRGRPADDLAVLVTVTIGVLLLLDVVLLGIIRWASLWLLVVLAPLVMGISVLPGGIALARLWWRLQLTAVLLPVANAVLLGTYLAMVGSPHTALLGALSGAAVLALMARLPGWAAGAALSAGPAEVRQRLTGVGQGAARVSASPTAAGAAWSGDRRTLPIAASPVPASPVPAPRQPETAASLATGSTNEDGAH